MTISNKDKTVRLLESLKELGFTITEEGKHYKLVYYGDGRYWATMVKTPSDKVRGGKNSTLEIIRDML